MMSEKEYNRTVAKNLRRIMHEKGKTQADMSRDLKIGKTTISAWMNGVHIPRMEKIDLICKYLGCSRSDLLETDRARKTTPITEEQAELIQRTMSADPHDIRLLLDFMRRLEQT